MPRTALNKLVPKADYHLIRSFPKVAQSLESQVHGMERSGLEAYLKLLPDAIERFQNAVTTTNDLHETVEGAILQLVTSFGSRNAAAVESMPLSGTSNTPAELEETADSVGDSELPNGSDTGQQATINSLPHNELQASAGSGGEVSHQQAGPRNPRVKRAPSSGRARYKQRLRELAETAGDQGRLSESEGGPNAKG